MSTPENKVKTKVKRILDDLRVYHFSPMMNGYGRAGVPDIICCVNGHFVGIECKAGSNRPTALQAREMRLINESGGSTFVVNENNIEELWGLLVLLRDDGDVRAMMQ